MPPRALFTSVIVVLAAVLALSACSREGENWRSAQSADTLESYEEFVQQHPDSAHAIDAQARIVQLGEERDWEAATAANDAAAFQQFLAQHPDGKWAQEARVRIASLDLDAAAAPAAPAPSLAQESEPQPKPTPRVATAPPPEPTRPAAAPGAMKPPSAAMGLFAVQLGAFSTAAAAEAQWKQLVAQHRDQLGSLTHRLEAGKAGAAQVYRLHAGALPEERARALCAALRAKAASCVVVPPA